MPHLAVDEKAHQYLKIRKPTPYKKLVIYTNFVHSLETAWNAIEYTIKKWKKAIEALPLITKGQIDHSFKGSDG
jgi:hypothetical protein